MGIETHVKNLLANVADYAADHAAKNEPDARSFVDGLKQYLNEGTKPVVWFDHTPVSLKDAYMEFAEQYVSSIPRVSKFSETLTQLELLLSAGIAGAFAQVDDHPRMFVMFGTLVLTVLGQMHLDRRKFPHEALTYLRTEEGRDAFEGSVRDANEAIRKEMKRFGHFVTYSSSGA
jgi:hypothetical protein